MLDTSAIIAGLDPFAVKQKQYTVPSVMKEVDGESIVRLRVKMAVENGRISVETPEKVFLEKARAAASLVGDEYFLSETDLQVLALALELKTAGCLPLIITDDYSIQNVATQMGLEFASLVTFGIRKHLLWVRYCPACHKRYPADYKAAKCEVCGTDIKRKPVKGKHIRR